jgi:hypothetical protein
VCTQSYDIHEYLKREWREYIDDDQKGPEKLCTELSNVGEGREL